MIVAGFFHDLSTRVPLTSAGRWFDLSVRTRLDRGEIASGDVAVGSGDHGRVGGEEHGGG